ncbi:TetR/AcrR family transcriptional regulator [Curtobacterium sp. ISL-83]|uniref:TetR/AcrR family transcriptional regulator n=1 Tax=Curtobacterium sp. ISL-83 TaxID=2819145 RepID=UPI001BE957F6|nr:TetR/AcrR family transcriptional regulator [Curtobacterium sp. ISL-83]MBT2504109.1 TetR/AcrR family transcriptional regulator [Curtobacterium sp. ISL-83]
MGRWAPGARERLVLAAVDLFHDQGYDGTTVAQITERAGVTKSTFFRHFSDKRELLVAGQAAMSALLAEGIAAAPPEASALDAVANGLRRAASAYGPLSREIAPRLEAVVSASAELRERSAQKSVGLAAAMEEALIARGITPVVAQLAAELGVLAHHNAFARWAAEPNATTEAMADYSVEALSQLRTAAATLA